MTVMAGLSGVREALARRLLGSREFGAPLLQLLVVVLSSEMLEKYYEIG